MTFSAGVLFSVLAAAGVGDLLSFLIRSTLIAAAGLFLCFRLRRASAAKRHLAATAALIALIALPVAKPLAPVLPLPILPAAPPSTPVRAEVTPVVSLDGTPRVSVVPGNGDMRSTGSGGSPASTDSGRRLSDYVILAWLLVSSALLFHVLVSLLAAAVAARRARPIEDPELGQELELACRRLGVSRPVRLRECSSITVPAVWGFVRPVLLLPAEAREWTRERIRVVFLHELAHVARHDGVGLLLARVATSVFWFHPLVWRLARVARWECERSCDDRVLAAGERATDYAAHLLAIMRSMTHRNPFSSVAPAMAQGSNLENRLASILRPGQRRDCVSRSGLIATIGCTCLLLVATTVVEVVAASEPYDEYSELVRRANRDAREHAREVEAAVMAALAAIEDPEESDAGDEGESPCADPPSPSVLSIVPRPEVVDDSAAPLPLYAVAGPQAYTVAGSRRHRSGTHNESGIELLRDGQYSRAIAAFEEEIRQTGSSTAMYNLACAHALKGDKKRAFDALEKAIEHGFDNTHHMGEDEDLRSLQGDPHFYELVRLARDLQLFGSGRFGDMDDEEDWQRAVPRLERVTREHPDIGRAWSNLGFARLLAGDAKGGAAAYQKALDLGYEKPTTLYNLACCAARSGDIDGAFRWLDRADQAGFEIGQHAGSDSDLDALRGDPRYGAMLKRWDEKMAKQHREEHKTETKQRVD